MQGEDNVAVHYDAIYWLNYSAYEDLRFYEMGRQKCTPGYGYGPIIRDKYILHYIISGEGRLEMDGKTFPVHANQAFVIPPGVLGYYEASMEQPWHYIWLQFHGPKAVELLQKAGITRKNPVFTPDGSCEKLERCLLEMLDMPTAEYSCIGKLYEFFQQLVDLSANQPQAIEKSDSALQYIRTVINYISQKYSEPIRIQEIADYCGLDRTYLGKIFKNATGYTPQKYLIMFRMKKAAQLLKETDIPIQHVSYSVGYNDPLSFSKVFKQEMGDSPTEYRSSRKDS